MKQYINSTKPITKYIIICIFGTYYLNTFIDMDISVLAGLELSGFSPKLNTFDPSVFNKDRIDAIRYIIASFFDKTKRVKDKSESRSYWLKHRVEEYAQRVYDPVLGNYITNGELIYAMLLEGFKVKKVEDKNALFNVSKRSINRLLKAPDKPMWL